MKFVDMVDEILHDIAAAEPSLYYTAGGLEYILYNVHTSPDQPNTPIKIFTGNTRTMRQTYIDIIENYKNLLKDTEIVLQKPIFSTLTLTGLFENLIFNEMWDFDMIHPKDNRIIKMKCNFGEYYHPHPAATVIEKTRRCSTRRTQNKKLHHKRRVAGNGRSFGSQITFYIYSNLNNNIYKAKVFRNGRFQIPGIQTHTMLDVIQPLIILRDALREEFVDDSINISYITPVMLNCTSKIVFPNILIDLNACEECLLADKIAETTRKKALFEAMNNMVPQSKTSNKRARGRPAQKNPNADAPSVKTTQNGAPKEMPNTILTTIGHYTGDYFTNISEIQNNPERYFGVVVRFKRSMPWSPEKRSTVKVLKALKVNLDGVNNMLECVELYCWFTWFYTRYEHRIVQRLDVMPDSSADEYESLYDSDPDLIE